MHDGIVDMFNFNFFQQMSFDRKQIFVPKAKRQVQKFPTSIGGEMNEVLSYFFSGCPNTWRNRGTQSKSSTSCGNLSVQNPLLTLR